MEVFNVKRRDIFDFDRFMDLKQPGFGGPASAEAYKDEKGNRVNKEPKLKEFQHTMERHELWKSPHYDSTYKAATNDIVYKQDGKTPTNYADPYHTAIPVKIISDKMQENYAITSFTDFLNEQAQPGDQTISVRNVHLAEDELDKLKIDWDGFEAPPSGIRGKSFTKDGKVVAWYDEDAKDLIIADDAGTMSDEDHAAMYGDEPSQGDADGDGIPDEDDFSDDNEDGYADIGDEFGSGDESDIAEVERLLASFEEDGESTEDGEDEDEDFTSSEE